MSYLPCLFCLYEGSCLISLVCLRVHVLFALFVFV